MRRLFCLGGVLIGLFITAEPTIFSVDGAGGDAAGGPQISAAARVLYPTAFALGFVPVAVSYVLTEKEMKREEVRER